MDLALKYGLKNQWLLWVFGKNYIDGFGKFIFNDKIRYGIWREGKLIEKINKKNFFQQIKDEHNIYLKYFQLDNHNAVLNFIKEN